MYVQDVLCMPIQHSWVLANGNYLPCEEPDLVQVLARPLPREAYLSTRDCAVTLPADALRAQLRWTTPTPLRNLPCALPLPHHLTKILWKCGSLAALLCARDGYHPRDQ